MLRRYVCPIIGVGECKWIGSGLRLKPGTFSGLVPSFQSAVAVLYMDLE